MADVATEWWRGQSLERQFLLAGSAVALVAMLLVGWLITSLIASNVTRNAAASTALYVDSIIAPLLPDMQNSTLLDDGVAKALDETLALGALGQRLAAFRLWRSDGTILYSKDHSEIGRRMEPSADLRTALSGEVVAQFNEFDETERATVAKLGSPLLEIYNPILQPWSGDIVAVSEFYEIATDLEDDLARAQLIAWAAVALTVLTFFGSLYAIVRRGSHTIDRQQKMLNERVDELTASSAANHAMRVRVQKAARRSAALNERHLRSIGADLHDGPAQLIALASLRMETDALLQRSSLRERKQVVDSVRRTLDEAMLEIRTICNGLVLPNIESAQLHEVVALAARAHEQRTMTNVNLDQQEGGDREVAAPIKICAFRFVQEALTNAYRHAGGRGQQVTLRHTSEQMVIEVSDKGTGFRPEMIGRKGLGLAGLKDRVESLGGHLEVDTSPNGTRLSMILNGGALEQQ